MRIPGMLTIFLSMLHLKQGVGEKVQSLATHTSSCFSCGMIEGLGYLTLKVCGDSNCCLSRSLNNDNINWIAGQTDTFVGSAMLECDQFSIGNPPFTVTAFHDGTDGLTLDWIEVRTEARLVRCNDLSKLDAHSWVKSSCY